MTKSTSLLQHIRAEFEEALLTNPLVSELSATGGHIIPRALFIIETPNGERKARISAMREPPSMSHFDLIQKAALRELLDMAEGGNGAVCVVYSVIKGLFSEKGDTNGGIALLDWQTTDGGRQVLLLRPVRGGESVEVVEVSPSRLDVICRTLSAAIQVVGRPDSLMDTVLERMVPLITPVIRALAPTAPDDDAAAVEVAAQGTVLEALKDYAGESVKTAMGLAEARAESVLAHMCMTVGMLQTSMADIDEAHQQEIARMRNNWERQQSKAASKLQRELEMTRKRADTLARHLQTARDEARKVAPGAAGVSVPNPAQMPSIQSTTRALRSPLQRRMANYLNEFAVFQADTRANTPT